MHGLTKVSLKASPYLNDVQCNYRANFTKRKKTSGSQKFLAETDGSKRKENPENFTHV